MNNQLWQNRDVHMIEKPLKEIMDLNLRTLSTLKYLNPADLLSSRDPGSIIERNVDMVIQNSLKTMDYFQNIFEIAEKNWFSIPAQARASAQETIKPTKAPAKKASSRKAKKRTIKLSDSAQKKLLASSNSKKKAATKKVSKVSKARASKAKSHSL